MCFSHCSLILFIMSLIHDCIISIYLLLFDQNYCLFVFDVVRDHDLCEITSHTTSTDEDVCEIVVLMLTIIVYIMVIRYDDLICSIPSTKR